MMETTFKQLTNFLVDLGIEKVPHTGKSYLAHLIGVYRFMQEQGCNDELCRAGMFHSIYGTEQFQGFKLELDRRSELRQLIGERAEHLGYLNCAMDRASFDLALDQPGPDYRFRDRITGSEVVLHRADFDDLCKIHLYDWLEQAPRSRFGWDYRRQSYRRLAERLGPVAEKTYESVYSQEAAAKALTV